MHTIRLSRVESWVGATAFLLPLLASVALYLPGGLLMPARLAILVLMLLGLAITVRDRALCAPWTAAWCGLVATCFALFGTMATLRSGHLVVAEAASVAIIMAGLATAVLLARSTWLLGGLVAGWIAATIPVSLVALWELATSRHLPLSVGTVAYADVPDWNEITSFFDNPNLYAYHCTVSLLLSPVAWHLLGPGRRRWALVPLGLLVAALLLRTHGQMALVAALLGVAWWALRSRTGRLVLLAGVVLVLATMVLGLPPGSSIVHAVEVAIDGLQWEEKSTFIRMALAQTACWTLGIVGPLGAGTGGFELWARTEGSPAYVTGFANAHWGMLEVMVNYGLVTLAVVVLALLTATVWGLWRGVTLRRRGDTLGSAVAHGAGALALTTPVICMSHSTWLVQPLTAVHLMTLVAALAVAEHRRRTGHPLAQSDSDD